MTKVRLFVKVDPKKCCEIKGTLPDCPYNVDAVVQCRTCMQWWRSIQNGDHPYWRKCSSAKALGLVRRWGRKYTVYCNEVGQND